MPLLDGFATLDAVKETFQRHNTRFINRPQPSKGIDGDCIYVLRPMICFFSQFTREKFVHFFTQSEQPEFYLEKPLALRELTSLMRLIKIV